MDELPDGLRTQFGADQGGDTAPTDLELNRLQGLGPDRFGDGCGKRKRRQARDLGAAEMPQQRAALKRQAGIGANQFHGPPAGRADRTGGLLEHRRRRAHTG